jgi:cell division protein FtsI (penicillin-binding protein 3)
MLHAVTSDDGTARRARVPCYRVGGKTGTVHKVGPSGYEKHKYVALFAGIAPIDNPRIVTVVVINDPQGERYGGGAVAAPVFSEITSDALRILNIPPTEIGSVEVAATIEQGGPA